jgi:hypothetical protein
MEGNIVATYKTQWGTCLISDAAYDGRTEEELNRVRQDIQNTVRSILLDISRRDENVKRQAEHGTDRQRGAGQLQN